MAVSSVYPFNPPTLLHSHRLSQSQSQAQAQALRNVRSVSNQSKIKEMIFDNDKERGRRSSSMSRFVVLSSHSNAKIVKSNRKSRYGQTLSPYDTDEDEEDNDDDDLAEDDWLLDDEFADHVEFEVDGKIFNSQKRINAKPGSQRQLGVRTGKNAREKSIVRNFYHTKNRTTEADSLDIDGKGKLMTGKSPKNRYQKLYEEIDLDEKWQILTETRQDAITCTGKK